MFYNTINISGPELREAVRVAESQQDAIMLIFNNSKRPYTPSEIWGMLQRAGHSWLLTSTRRAITDLTTGNKLEMLPNKKIGLYNKPEHYWQLKK